jgi:hypothetical protein
MKEMIDNVTEADIKNFFLPRGRMRLAKSIKFSRGEIVTPTDTPRKQGAHEYLFVSSIRWISSRYNSYGGYMLLNPRTGKLISATNIRSLKNCG